jgi:hypothetical protein
MPRVAGSGARSSVAASRACRPHHSRSRQEGNKRAGRRNDPAGPGLNLHLRVNANSWGVQPEVSTKPKRGRPHFILADWAVPRSRACSGTPMTRPGLPEIAVQKTFWFKNSLASSSTRPELKTQVMLG